MEPNSAFHRFFYPAYHIKPNKWCLASLVQPGLGVWTSLWWKTADRWRHPGRRDARRGEHPTAHARPGVPSYSRDKSQRPPPPHPHPIDGRRVPPVAINRRRPPVSSTQHTQECRDWLVGWCVRASQAQAQEKLPCSGRSWWFSVTVMSGYSSFFFFSGQKLEIMRPADRGSQVFGFVSGNWNSLLAHIDCV